MSRPRLVRLNGSRYEFLPAPGRDGLRGTLYELKRKADDRAIARARLSRRGSPPRLRFERVDGALEVALDDVASLLIDHFGHRGRLAIEARGARQRGAAAQSPAIALPDDYAARTGLPQHPEPRVLAYAGLDMFARRQWLTPAAARGWRRMRDAARAEGVELLLVSAYRSVVYQTVLVQRKLARGLTIDQILAVNAAPGYSEHHSGRALDLTAPGSAPAEESFEGTDAFAWLTRRAGEFGFRLSYPRGNPHGILYEPWHWCHQKWGRG